MAFTRRLVVALAALAVTVLSGTAVAQAPTASARPAPSKGLAVANVSPLSDAQRSTLMRIARDTWRFYSTDVDPTTHLPLDNLTYARGGINDYLAG